jgi:CAAX protease family protein
VALASGMFGPAIAALLVAFKISPLPDARRALGLRLHGPGPGRRAVPAYVIGWVGPPLMVALAIGFSWALGQVKLDLRDFSGLRATIEQTGMAEQVFKKMTIHQLVLVQLALIPVAPLLNAIPCLGEELGWRGYLLPRLLPLGQWRALVLSGAIWGLWHAPVIARGYNYPQHPYAGVAAMTVFCVLQGVLFGWLRLESGSVWPAVIAHGALNGSAGLIKIVEAAGSQADTLHATILGWSGWLLLGAAIALLVWRKRLPVAGVDPTS